MIKGKLPDNQFADSNMKLGCQYKGVARVGPDWEMMFGG